MSKKYFVDLFAGCGGLSLGLENAGFIPAYVNEINPDALESYLVNRDSSNPELREKYHSRDIKSLTQKPRAINMLVKNLSKDYGIKKNELDLIVGGPPCQGYSIIGHKRTFAMDKNQLPYNHLYKDMIKVIRGLNPKCFLFENVGGILSGKWTSSGKRGEIWNNVKKSFSRISGYDIQSELIHAKSYGVPQNRPRVILIGIRKDMKFDRNDDLPAKGLLPLPSNDHPDPQDLLSDLIDPNYCEKSSTNIYLKNPTTPIQKQLRGSLKKGNELTNQEYSNHADHVKKKFSYMLKHDGKIPTRYKTKKFYQKLLPYKWEKSGPNITITGSPEDYVHYCQPRILTVREWARFQMFPDWYMFAGKRTTGGRRRAGDPAKGIWERESPKYTQIGNAVPVKLAEKIGLHLHKIIN